MSFFHAAFSGGGVAGALSAGTLLSAGGGLAEVFGLRIALGTIAVAGLVILALSYRVGGGTKGAG